MTSPNAPMCGIINRLEYLGQELKNKGWEAPRRYSPDSEVIGVGWDDGSWLLISYFNIEWLVPPTEIPDVATR